MKKLLSMFVTLAMLTTACFTLSSCGQKTATTEETKATETASKDFKIGFIFLHDENSGYDRNFMNAAKDAIKELGLTEDQYVMKTNIPDGNECYEAAADLADQGCTVVFADSFGHEQSMLKAAKEYPEVQFLHATGTNAHTEKLDNYHNSFANIYEGRYLAGIAAGMKLNQMIENGEFTADEAKIGYVGAYTYAEVISGYTAFFLGARSVCPTATMEVQFTGSWYDETLEQEAATKLIANNCKLISQHADSMGAPTACENAGVPNVSYNGSTLETCPNTFLVSSRVNWTPYFLYAIKACMDGEKMEYDWCNGIGEDCVVVSDINDNVAAPGTQEAIDEAKAKIISGDLHVFDTATFTVDGAALTEYMADVDSDADYTPDTNAISDGFFHESEFRSAPYFDVKIDGIELLNTMF